jgi:hypothetical protein
MSYRWFLLFMLWLPAFAFANDVSAKLDRDQVYLGETVTLNVRIGGGGSIDNPDLSALNQDFDILGTSSNSSYSVINGHIGSELTLGIALRPKHVGTLQIPPLTIAGATTQPLSLQVSAPDNASHSDADKDVFLEASANPEQAYVNQQLLYTVRLYSDVNLSGGVLPDPQMQNAEVRRLGGNDTFETERNGKRYHVIQRRYAIVPQQAGTLTIPALSFQGNAVNAGDPQDPGDFFGQSGLFANTAPVSADAPVVSVEVRATPSDWGKTTWLPARALTLSLDGMSDSQASLTVGQPLNVRMVLQATGLPAEALPEPNIPALDGATVYPEPPHDTTQDDGEWLIGRRERSLTIIPTRTGTLTIPATTLTWFDVQSNHTEVASIPAHTFHVSPAAISIASGSSSAQPAIGASASAPASPLAMSKPALTVSLGSLWQRVALVSLGLWLLSMMALVWWYWRGRASRTNHGVPSANASPVLSDHALRHAFFEMARGSDSMAQARALLAWARAERVTLQNLGQLSAALSSALQCKAIDQLQRAQYAERVVGEPVDMHAAFASGFQWRRDEGSDDDSLLPPLYPFKLH